MSIFQIPPVSGTKDSSMAASKSGSRVGGAVPLRAMLRWAAIVLAFVILLPYAVAPLYRFINPVSTLMLWRWMTGERVERQWTPLAEISPSVPIAVIVAEDGQFCTHHGVDLGELRNALTEMDDLSDARGGSTITQQVAKNLFLWQSRSYVRKALELPLAIWIDLVLPKRRILEIYLNIAELGPNGEFGVQAASQRAFGHPALDLKPPEAALMAATLPNPHTRDAAKPGPGLRRIAGVHLRRMSTMAGRASCIRTR
jgi:monofunctional biosynthetic peptidoglycan transglycosylase